MRAEADADQATITDLRRQLSAAQAQLSAFPELAVYQNYGNDPIVTDVTNRAFSTWSPRIGPNIGGNADPVAYSAKMVNGKIVLSITGKPKAADGTQYWSSALWANKRPPLPIGVTKFEMGFGVTQDANVQFVQTIEHDTIVEWQGFEYNGSVHVLNKTGEIQIANGTPAPGKTTGGGWLSTGIFPGMYSPNVRHDVRVRYRIDRTAKTLTYDSFIIDGKKYQPSADIATQPAYAQPGWSDQLTIQLQQDVNSLGGSFTTAFDSIRYVGL